MVDNKDATLVSGTNDSFGNEKKKLCLEKIRCFR